MLFCTEEFGLRYPSLVRVARSGFGRPLVLSRGKMPRTRVTAAYVRDGLGIGTSVGHHFRLWYFGGYHFTLILFRLAIIEFNYFN